MQATQSSGAAAAPPSEAGHATAWVLAIAGLTLAVHAATGGRYGFHRDELATLNDARHLAWGYVAYPPVTPFFGRLSLALFGTSLAGFRFFAALAEAVAVALTGFMARHLGGGQAAQIVAAAAAVPFALAGGSLMQYVSFDYLAWTLLAYCAIRFFASSDPRWWYAMGAAAGFGLLAKYTMPLPLAGLALGLALSPWRREFGKRQLWLGLGIAALIFAPNLLWEARHEFITLDFLRHIHLRDVGEGRANGFLPGQFTLTLLGSLLALAGLGWFLFSRDGRRFRPMAWIYLFALAALLAAQGRFYYLAPGYPFLYAAGAVLLERSLRRRRRWPRALLYGAVALALTADAVLLAAYFVPIAPVGSAWFQRATQVNGDLREEFGWHALVETAAQIRDQLPAAERPRLGILAANYGEAGAINLYGPAYHLPAAISGINSFWARGYGDPPPTTLIVFGLSARAAAADFTGCRLAAHAWNRYGIHNEELDDHPGIFVCGPPRQGWAAFWSGFRYFG